MHKFSIIYFTIIVKCKYTSNKQEFNTTAMAAHHCAYNTLLLYLKYLQTETNVSKVNNYYLMVVQ